MYFKERKTITKNDYPNGSYEVECGNTLLVGCDRIYIFHTDNDKYGYYRNEVYPAFYDGRRAWLIKKIWISIAPYSADGMEESILDFRSGIDLLLKHECFHCLLESWENKQIEIEILKEKIKEFASSKADNMDKASKKGDRKKVIYYQGVIDGSMHCLDIIKELEEEI
jgi:hypothetical protein